MGIEAVPVVLLGDRIPRPVRGLEVLEDDPRLAVLVGIVAPDVEVAPRAAARGAAGPLEPRMLVRGVVADQLGDHPQPAPVRLADELAHVAQRAVVGVDAEVVGDVVAVVLERRRIERQHPDRRDAEVAQVVELLGQALEVADAVAVAVAEGADVDLVDDRVLVPERIVRERRRGEERLGEVFLLDRGHRVGLPVAGCVPGACPGRARSAGRRVPHVSRPPSSRSVATTPRPGSRPSAPWCSRSVPARRAWGSRLTTVSTVSRPSADCLVYASSASSSMSWKHEPLVRLEGRVLAADPVDLADQRSERVGPLQVPAADLVLLRVQVLLAAGLARDVLEQLERRAVDPVRRAQRRRHDVARLEHRPAAGLERLVEDVRRVRPDVRAEELRRPAGG